MPEENDHEPMLRSVRTRRDRARHWDSEGKASLLRHLVVVGSLGWLIIAPTLAGVALGRWIDGELGTGIQATAALLVAGAATGCWLAWKRMHLE